MSNEQGSTVIVLDVVEPGVVPDYCVHGKATCVHCDEWCWLGDNSFEVVNSSKALPLCRACAIKLIPPDSRTPIEHVHDHRRADGPHS